MELLKSGTKFSRQKRYGDIATKATLDRLRQKQLLTTSNPYDKRHFEPLQPLWAKSNSFSFWNLSSRLGRRNLNKLLSALSRSLRVNQLHSVTEFQSLAASGKSLPDLVISANWPLGDQSGEKFASHAMCRLANHNFGLTITTLPSGSLASHCSQTQSLESFCWRSLVRANCFVWHLHDFAPFRAAILSKTVSEVL